MNDWDSVISKFDEALTLYQESLECGKEAHKKIVESWEYVIASFEAGIEIPEILSKL